MARWVIFPVSVIVLGVLLLLGTHTSTFAQATSTPTPFVQSGEATAVAVTIVPVNPQPPDTGIARAALVLTLQDTGRSFVIPVNTLIILQIPRGPFFRLSYDPNILQEIDIQPMPMEPAGPTDAGQGPESPQSFPAPGWRLVAIRPGTSPLRLEQEPCRRPPCPMMPIFNFSVTITVTTDGPIPPQPPPVRSDVYIGTAYLNQTIVVQVGQVVTLELPFLAPGRQVHLQFDPTILRPLPGQNLNYPQPGGWHFIVAQSGTSPLIVQGDACIDGSLDCQPSILFQVTITTASTNLQQ